MRSRCVSAPYTIKTVYGNVEGYPLNNGFHTGVDYISDGRILAPMDATVTAISKTVNDGNYLVLEAPGYRDWFSHIKEGGYKVSVGQQVKRGQHVADQGATGFATGVHVHHSLRKNGVMVDPELNITKEGEDMATNAEIDATVSYLHYAYFGKPAPDAVFESWRGLLKNNYVDGLQTIFEACDPNPEALKNQPQDFISVGQLYVKK